MDMVSLEKICLEQVTTISEACERWDKNKKTVRMLCLSGALVARQAGSTWLISTDSLVRRWGNGKVIHQG